MTKQAFCQQFIQKPNDRELGTVRQKISRLGYSLFPSSAMYRAILEKASSIDEVPKLFSMAALSLDQPIAIIGQTTRNRLALSMHADGKVLLHAGNKIEIPIRASTTAANTMLSDLCGVVYSSLSRTVAAVASLDIVNRVRYMNEIAVTRQDNVTMRCATKTLRMITIQVQFGPCQLTFQNDEVPALLLNALRRNVNQ